MSKPITYIITEYTPTGVRKRIVRWREWVDSICAQKHEHSFGDTWYSVCIGYDNIVRVYTWHVEN